MDNFKDFCHILEVDHAALRVRNEEALAQTIIDLLHDNKRRDDLAAAAQRAADRHAHVLDDMLAVLQPYIETV